MSAGPGTGVASACPQCGAPLRFGGAQSLAACCAYCRAAVLRTGADLSLAGKVPDLVAVDTRLSLGATGRAGGEPFTVLGRLQLSRGDATWNEWYAAFARGVGWLAEAQGRLYLTRDIADAGGLPPVTALSPGGPLEVPALGRFTVDEVGAATLVSFEGELPLRPELGATYRYADASDGSGAFLTLDYGTGETDPDLFAGRELAWSEVSLPGGAAPAVAGREAATALACPNCGAPVALARPAEAKAATCPACRALLDVKQGALRLVEVLEGRSQPPVPLGAKGRVRGEEVQVLGWLRRASRSDGETFEWDELLLHGANGYRWLSVYAGHWLWLRPLPAGEVDDLGAAAVYRGVSHRLFQSTTAKVLELQGEFYWELRAGDLADTRDYVAPPSLLSSERTRGDGGAEELAWTVGEYLSGDELWEGLGLSGVPPRATGIAPAQPNPWSRRAAAAWRVGGVALGLFFALAVALFVAARREPVLTLDAPLEAGRVTISEPFELTGGPQALEIEAVAAVDQAWVGLDLALIHEESGEAETLGVELSRFSGVDADGAWSEGSNRGSGTIGGVKDGRYVLRVEPEIEAQWAPRLGPTALVRVTRGVFLWTPALLTLVALLAWPLAASWRAAAFEGARWAESDPHGGNGWDGSGGDATGGGDEDEEDDA